MSKYDEKEEYGNMLDEYDKMVSEELKEELSELRKLRIGRMKMRELVRLSNLLDQAGIPREEKRRILAQITPYFSGGKSVTEGREIAEEKAVNTLPIIAQAVKDLSEDDVRKAAIILQALRGTGQVDTTTALMLSVLGTVKPQQPQQQQQISLKDVLEVFKELKPQQQQSIDWEKIYKLIQEERDKRLQAELEVQRQQYQQQFQELIETLNNLRQSLQSRGLTLDEIAKLKEQLQALGFKIEPSSSANIPLTEAEVQKQKLMYDKEIMLKKLEWQRERDRIMYDKVLGLIEKLLAGLVMAKPSIQQSQSAGGVSVDTRKMRNLVKEVVEGGEGK